MIKIEGDHVEYREGAFLDVLRAAGIKPSKAAIQFDKLAPEITTRQEWGQIRDHIFWQLISDPDLDPTQRRELLADKDTCRCCNQWLGHNHPPADADVRDDQPYRRQSSFDFGKKK